MYWQGNRYVVIEDSPNGVYELELEGPRLAEKNYIMSEWIMPIYEISESVSIFFIIFVSKN